MSLLIWTDGLKKRGKKRKKKKKRGKSWWKKQISKSRRAVGISIEVKASHPADLGSFRAQQIRWDYLSLIPVKQTAHSLIPAPPAAALDPQSEKTPNKTKPKQQPRGTKSKQWAFPLTRGTNPNEHYLKNYTFTRRKLSPLVWKQ